MEIDSVKTIIKQVPPPKIEPVAPVVESAPQAQVPSMSHPPVIAEAAPSESSKQGGMSQLNSQTQTKAAGNTADPKKNEEKEILDDLHKSWNEQRKISDKSLREMMEKANKRMRESEREVDFSIHEKTNTMMIKVVNSKTKEVVKEYPPEEMLDVLAKLLENAGLLVDEKS